MKVTTHSSYSLADSFVAIAENDLDKINMILLRVDFKRLFSDVPTDYPPESLFRALLLREWYNLSYENLSESLRRDIVFMNFCGFSLSANKPDPSTLIRFRDKMIRRNLWEKTLDEVNRKLEELNLKVCGGTCVLADVTLVPSARRPRKVTKEETNKNAESGGDEKSYRVTYSHDVEASWIKKAKKPLLYGYGVYTTTDADGFVEGIAVRPAGESEQTNFSKVTLGLIQTDGRKKVRLLYDKGSDSAANRKALKDKGIGEGIMRRKPKAKKLSYWNKRRNKIISSLRFVIERTFGTIKRVYALSRAKLIGIPKVTSEGFAKSVAYNLRRASNLMELPAHAR